MQPTLPTDRPIRGADTLSVQRKLGISRDDMRWMLGLNPTSMPVTRAGDEPLPFPTAMVVRLLYRFPDLSLIPKDPVCTDFLALCQKIDPTISAVNLSVLFGCSHTAIYRWLQSDNPRSVAPRARRWMLFMWNALHAARTRTAQRELLDHFRESMLQEADARGFDRYVIERTQRWQLLPKKPDTPVVAPRPPKPKPARKTAATPAKAKGAPRKVAPRKRPGSRTR